MIQFHYGCMFDGHLTKKRKAPGFLSRRPSRLSPWCRVPMPAWTSGRWGDCAWSPDDRRTSPWRRFARRARFRGSVWRRTSKTGSCAGCQKDTSANRSRQGICVIFRNSHDSSRDIFLRRIALGPTPSSGRSARANGSSRGTGWSNPSSRVCQVASRFGTIGPCIQCFSVWTCPFRTYFAACRENSLIGKAPASRMT